MGSQGNQQETQTANWESPSEHGRRGNRVSCGMSIHYGGISRAAGGFEQPKSPLGVTLSQDGPTLSTPSVLVTGLKWPGESSACADGGTEAEYGC